MVTKKTKAKSPRTQSSDNGKASATQRTRVAADQLPRRSLEKAVPVASVLHQTYAGKSANTDELADALNLSKDNADFKYALWSAAAYGLINKEEAGKYSLAETGRKLVAPTYDGEDREARVKAVLTPAVLSKFYTEYNGHTIPGDAHLPNVLETRFTVPRDRIAEARTILVENARYAGILDESSGSQLKISLDGAAVVGGISASPPIAPQDGEITIDRAATTSIEWSKTCFFITPIGDDGSEHRKHADMILKHLVAPAAEANGLSVVRADKIDKSGLITQQILEHIAKARLCVTDLSFNNPNVFYELGIRHMTLLPSVQIIRKGDRIPFDVSQGRTIVVDTSDAYTIMDRIESARRELTEHIKNALQGNAKAVEDNPIAVYLPGLKVVLN